MISRSMPKWDRLSVQPAHFDIQPMTPLCAKFVRTRGEACDLVARKNDEIRLRCDARNDCVDLRECLRVKGARDA